MHRARILRLGVAGLCAVLAGPAAAQQWHSLAAGVPAGQTPTDLAFTVDGTTGAIDAWVVTWDGTTGGAGTVLPVTLPLDGPPVVGTAWTFTGVNEAPRLATDGTEVIVVYGAPAIEDFDGTSWISPSPYPTSLAAAGPAVHGVAIDASAVVLTTDSSLSRYNLAVRVGTTWTQTVTSNVASVFGPVALSGTAGIVLPGNAGPSPEGATDATLASGWTPTGVTLPSLDASGQVIAVSGVGFFAVGPSGALGFTTSSTTALTDASNPAGTPNLTRVVYQASPTSQCWIAGADGSIYQVLTPTTAPDWTTNAPLPTGLAGLTGLAVTAPRQILVAGTDSTGAGVVAWRNRAPDAPVLTTATPVAVTEGGAGVQISATATDPDGDPLTASWSCSGYPLATFSPATSTTTTLTVTDDPALCPSAGPQQVNCQLATTDGEPLSSAAGFLVQVTPVDVTPPTLKTLTVTTVTPGSPIYPGTPMIATIGTLTDNCSLASTTVEVLDSNNQRVGNAGTTMPFNFNAPATPSDYTLQVSATDSSTNTASLLAPFTVIPVPPDITMACPSVLPRGTSTTFTAVKTATSGDIATYDWAPAPPGTSDVAANVPTGSPQTLELTPDQCTHQASVDVSVTATNVGGTSSASCPAVPIDPTFPAPTVTAPADVTVPISAKGGSAPITVSVAETCTPATISLAWDLSGLPAAAQPTDAPASGPPGDFTATVKVAAADVASVLGPTGARDATVTVTVTDDLGAMPIVKTIAVHFVAHGALSVAVAAPGDEGEVAEGSIVAVDTQVSSALPFSKAGVDLGLHGFSLATQAAPQVLGGCGAKATVAAVKGGATVTLSPMPSGCPVTVRLFLRRDDGLGKVTVDGCTLGSAKVACTGDLPVKRSEVLGCSSAGGGETLWALALALGALALRRRVRAGCSRPA